MGFLERTQKQFIYKGLSIFKVKLLFDVNYTNLLMQGLVGLLL